MSMYADYLKEKSDIEYIEIKDKAFCTYVVQEHCYYIVDIYVKPEFRKSQVASKLADRIALLAKFDDKKFLLGAVEIDSKHEDRNKKVLEGYGFTLSHVNEDDMINYYVKEL